MKRKPILLALALLFVVGAALWGVNYRLDHPPLTKADKEFRALVAGADSVVVSQTSCRDKTCSTHSIVKCKPLNAKQTRELIEYLRFAVTAPETANVANVIGTTLNFSFRNGKRELGYFILIQNQQNSEFGKLPISSDEIEYLDGRVMLLTNQTSLLRINPRFNKRLNRTLDAYLPQRIRP